MHVADLNRRLDGLESGLPRPASQVLHLQRSAVAAAGGVARDAFEAVSQVTGTLLGTARDGVKTAIGQGRHSAQVTPPAAAEELADRLERTAAALEEAADAVVPDDLDGLTRGELLGRARELDIDGRTRMSKAQLVSAIRAAS
jgi:hypothetical protein